MKTMILLVAVLLAGCASDGDCDLAAGDQGWVTVWWISGVPATDCEFRGAEVVRVSIDKITELVLPPGDALVWVTFGHVGDSEMHWTAFSDRDGNGLYVDQVAGCTQAFQVLGRGPARTIGVNE
jgi:hypothetical protein